MASRVGCSIAAAFPEVRCKRCKGMLQRDETRLERRPGATIDGWIHRFINRVIDISISDVLRLKSELVESAPQNVQHLPGAPHLREPDGDREL
jgi:hypothetical protein